MKKTNEKPINKTNEMPASSKKEIVSPLEQTPASEQSDPIFRFIDKLYQANLGKLTAGISPAALGTAYYSWFAQLLQSPGSMLRLASYPLLHANDYLSNLFKYDKPRDGKDVRFHTDNWSYYPGGFGLNNFSNSKIGVYKPRAKFQGYHFMSKGQ